MRSLLCSIVAFSSSWVNARAQSTPASPGASPTTASTYSQSDVPTGVPIAGNYNQADRPQVHFSPPQGFMNDPNGMFKDANGTYHLYYQYNPAENVAGRQHWGHATSQDLYTWTNQPIALFPGGPKEGVFSGSAVVDVNNTSGFFPNQNNGVVAIYTINLPESETQHIAYSHDNGFSFTKYAGNPVLAPGGTNPTQFRDPKVIWHAETGKWVMVVAYPVDFKIGIFTSPNLREWKAESNFTHHGITGLQYECPNMVPINIKGTSNTGDTSMYLMLISINPGGPLGGSVSEYFLGTFNGTHFAAVDSTVRLTDFSKDNYAGQFFYGLPEGDQITLDWASNWQYTNIVPTAGEKLGDGFRSAMTVPRGHHLKDLPRHGLSLISYPYNIKTIIDSELALNSAFGNGVVQLDYSKVKSRALYFEANVTGLTSSDFLRGEINFVFSSSATNESITGGTSIGSGDVYLDRGKTTGFENIFFTDKFSATGLYNEKDAAWKISGIIDRSIIEIFLNEGELSATSTFFSIGPLDTMSLRITGIDSRATSSVGVWALKAAWLDQADPDGNVHGNSTRPASRPI